MTKFNIQKTRVTAKTRQLNSTWTFETPKVTVQPKSMVDLVKLWYLSNRGHHVPTYDHEQINEAISWCNEHTPGYAESSSRYPMSDSNFERELERRAEAGSWDGEPYETDASTMTLYGVNLESMIYDELATEIQEEIDSEILGSLGIPRPRKRPRAVHHFFFTQSDHALMFKLTWGGE